MEGYRCPDRIVHEDVVEGFEGGITIARRAEHDIIIIPLLVSVLGKLDATDGHTDRAIDVCGLNAKCPGLLRVDLDPQIALEYIHIILDINGAWNGSQYLLNLSG